jgi:hypothetical protein
VSVEAVQLAGAALFAGLGVWALVAGRRETEPRVHVAGVRVSGLSFQVAGYAAIVMAYHLVAYALDLTALRAPWPVAVSVAVGAVLLSLAADGFEGGQKE